jgi:hypothetical protein
MHAYLNGKYLGAAFATLAVCGLFATPLYAQWSSDPSLNLLVADGSNAQTQPKIGITNNGGCYVSWIDFGAAGGYAVRIQYFNAIGEPQFTPEITLFQTTLSWSQDYGLAVDAAGNAIVSCQITVGSDIHAGVQKVTQHGELPWGEAGIQASVIPDVSKPYVAVTSDGYYVVGWGESSDYLLQKFDADGVAQWAEPYREPHGTEGSFSMGGIGDGGNGSVIVQYVHQLGGMYSSKHLKAQKYDGDANKLWNGGEPVVIMDGYSLSMAYYPGFISDGQGGAVIGWYDGTTGYRRARVQHLNSDGVELLPHDGVEAAVPTDGKIALSTSVAYDRDNDEIYIGFTQANSAQSAWGLYAQRIDSDGTRAWGNQALALIPLSSLQCAYPRALWINGAFELFCVPSTAFTGSPIQGYRLDSQGTQLWDDVPLIVSSFISEKTNTLTAAATPSGMAILAWGDGRGGSYEYDVYAQNVNPDGSLGLPVFLWGDLNHDNSVNLTDLGQLLSHYGHTGMTYEDGDLDGDGDVDISDLATLLAHYGEGV